MRSFSRFLLAAAFIAGPSTAVAQPATVIVVRHAEKASATDPDPVLSELGTQRAKDLASALSNAHIGSIITTQYQRTRLTAADVIAATKLTPIVVSAASPTHVADVVAAIKARPAGEVVLVVGHSNTVAAIVAALGGPKMPNVCDSQYANMFVVEMGVNAAPKLIKAKYGAADP